MELGRDLEQYGDGYAIVVRYNFEKILRRWHFDTHRKAMRKFNELKKSSDWLPINDDVTI